MRTNQTTTAGTAAANREQGQEQAQGLAPDLLAEVQRLREDKARLMEACKIASGAETMTLKLKRLLLEAIAATEQEQEH